MPERREKETFWETKFRLRRRKHRLRKEKIERPESSRRSLKQVLREYRDRRSISASSRGQKAKNRFEGREVATSCGNECQQSNNQLDSNLDITKELSSAPAEGRKIIYREQASTESFAASQLPPGNLAAGGKFRPLEVNEAKSKSAPVCGPALKSCTLVFEPRPPSLETDLPKCQQNPRMELPQDSVRADFFNSSGERNRHFAPRCDIDVRSVTESVISTNPSEGREEEKKNGSSVMQKIESSILSFFGVNSTKESSLRQAKEYHTSVEPAGNGVMSFFSYRRTKGANKWEISSATDEIDYSIYGSQARYYM